MDFADEIWWKILEFVSDVWSWSFTGEVGFVILFLFCFATVEKRALALLLHAGEKYKQTEFPTEKTREG